MGRGAGCNAFHGNRCFASADANRIAERCRSGAAARRSTNRSRTILDAAVAKSGQKLNWKTSIVDLMKALGLDSSLEHRKELAKELGYTGDTGDSATMNVWLHKQVIQKLKDNGGKVPAGL